MVLIRSRRSIFDQSDNPQRYHPLYHLPSFSPILSTPHTVEYRCRNIFAKMLNFQVVGWCFLHCISAVSRFYVIVLLWMMCSSKCMPYSSLCCSPLCAFQVFNCVMISNHNCGGLFSFVFFFVVLFQCSSVLWFFTKLVEEAFYLVLLLFVLYQCSVQLCHDLSPQRQFSSVLFSCVLFQCSCVSWSFTTVVKQPFRCALQVCHDLSPQQLQGDLLPE